MPNGKLLINSEFMTAEEREGLAGFSQSVVEIGQLLNDARTHELGAADDLLLLLLVPPGSVLTRRSKSAIGARSQFARNRSRLRE